VHDVRGGTWVVSGVVYGGDGTWGSVVDVRRIFLCFLRVRFLGLSLNF
jgi:hypothetical protein